MQVVLPEALCTRLAALAERESRTVSNMAKVLIQEGVQQYEAISTSEPTAAIPNTEKFGSNLEAQEPKLLQGAPRRVRLFRPSNQ